MMHGKDKLKSREIADIARDRKTTPHRGGTETRRTAKGQKNRRKREIARDR